MIWKAYCDGEPLYIPDALDKQIAGLQLSLEVSSPGTFDFTIYPGHPLYGRIRNRKSLVEVYCGEERRFRGRVIRTAETLLGAVTVTCEGELAFLLDTVQRPFEFPTDPAHASPADYLAFLINRHNTQAAPAQKFRLGRVTVTDPNDYIARSDTEYSTTWELVKTGLLDTLGGFLVTSEDSSGQTVLSYYAEPDSTCMQGISTDVNLLGFGQETDGTEVVTALIPLAKVGEGDDEHVIDISSEADAADKTGDMIFSATAEQRIGYRVIRSVWYDGITTTAGLARKARKDLQKLTADLRTVTVSAVDILGGGFKVGEWVEISIPEKDLTGRFAIEKLSFQLDNPAQNSIEISAEV